MEDLVKIEQRWDRLRNFAAARGLGVITAAMDTVEAQMTREMDIQARRFASYRPARPADEPHDAGCQVTLYGEGHCCTCESNAGRRRQQVSNAGAAGDMAFRETLGSMEAFAFDLALNKAQRGRGARP